jgi:Domain of unknown function (DUF4440)
MRSALVVLIALVWPAALAAQAATVDDFLRIEREIGRANRECDYDYFRRIEADEFIFTGANGAVTTRAEDLAGEKDCHKTDYDQVIDEPRLLLYGTVAVFNARNTITVKGVLHRNRFTDVFVWRDGRWQLVAGHSSRIPS